MMTTMMIEEFVSVCRSDHFWLRLRNVVSWRFSETFGMNILTLYPKTKAPYNVTVYKGSNQAALTRAFVLYFLYRYIHFPYTRACRVRNGMSGLSVAVRAGASLLGRQLLPRVRQHSALCAFS